MGLLGTAKQRKDTRPPADGAELGDVVVKDLDGGEVALRELWAERPAVLVWLRHYG